MAHTLQFQPSLKMPAGTETLVVVGHKKNLQSKEFVANLPKAAQSLWAGVLARVEGGANGASTSLWIPDGKSKTKAIKVIVGVLPETSSRHNCVARPDAITRMVRAGSAAKKVSVWLVLKAAEHAFPAGCAAAEAFPLYSQKSKKSTSKTPKAKVASIAFSCADGSTISKDALGFISNAAASVRACARMVDTPTSELNTDHFVAEAKEVAKRTGTKITVLRQKKLEEKGFGGLVGVGQAADHEPALVVLTHKPTGAKKKVSWVGKGIVYDTGGLSLKMKGSMAGMKMDMGGAAAVLHAFEAAVMGGFPEELHAILCLAENSVGPNATRPDDILYMYSGKTVEVNNTDAEGRLVLADGVAYAVKNLKSDIIVDMATLTGAQLVATGRRHAGIVSNCEDFESAAVRAGRESGDLVHALPYCPEFYSGEFKSKVADMKNSVKDRMNAQTSCAGQFIANHLGDFKGKWLHVDLAGPTMILGRATGYGVALMVHLFNQGLPEELS